ncbi:MAG: hypothetical protein PHE24_00155 [Patescibacteria group bacterium]|nr:hypothetical protein [Patescibacteria group bacterium]
MPEVIEIKKQVAPDILLLTDQICVRVDEKKIHIFADGHGVRRWKEYSGPAEAYCGLFGNRKITPKEVRLKIWHKYGVFTELDEHQVHDEKLFTLLICGNPPKPKEKKRSFTVPIGEE